MPLKLTLSTSFPSSSNWPRSPQTPIHPSILKITLTQRGLIRLRHFEHPLLQTTRSGLYNESHLTVHRGHDIHPTRKQSYGHLSFASGLIIVRSIPRRSAEEALVVGIAVDHLDCVPGSDHSVMPFRFLDLPSELRIQVYRSLVVCDDTPKDIEVEEALESIMDHNHFCHRQSWRIPWHPIQIVHGMSASILRVNCQIHLEAHEVLHRDNQFIRVNGLPSILHGAVQHHGVPILSMDPSTQGFRGVTLEIELSNIAAQTRPHASESAMSVLLLGKHLPLLVEWLPEYPIYVVGKHSLATTTLRLSNARPTSTAVQMSLLARFRTHARLCSRYVIDGPWDNQLAITARQDLGLGSSAPDLDLRVERSKAFAAEAANCEAHGKSGMALRYMALSISAFRHYSRSSMSGEWQGRLAQLDFESLSKCAVAIERFWTRQPEDELRDASFDILAYHAIRMLRLCASIIVMRQDRANAARAYDFNEEQRKRLMTMAQSAESIKVAALEWEEATEEDFGPPTVPYTSS